MTASKARRRVGGSSLSAFTADCTQFWRETGVDGRVIVSLRALNELQKAQASLKMPAVPFKMNWRGH